MNRKDDHATKADISALKSDMSTLKTDLESKIGAVDAKIDERFGTLDVRIDAVDSRLSAKIDRVARDLVMTQADVREIKENMATKGHMERLMRCFDDFAARAVHYDRADATRGQALIKVEVMAEDHERRIQALESAPRHP